ncbi:MAG: DUF6636 domain-containing protein, partial [Pseudomonadota bacterium]
LAGDIFFKSPSGNIHCMLSDDPAYAGARCDIMRVTRLSFPNPPFDCDLDWGHAFFVGPYGGGRPVCAGDTVASPSASVLPYGMMVSAGSVSCLSTREGMDCFNQSGGRFLLRRANQIVQ